MQNTLRAHWHTYISAWTYTGSSYQSGIFTFPSGFCKQSWTIQIYLNRRFFVMTLGGKTFTKTRGKSKSKKIPNFPEIHYSSASFWVFGVSIKIWKFSNRTSPEWWWVGRDGWIGIKGMVRHVGSKDCVLLLKTDDGWPTHPWWSVWSTDGVVRIKGGLSGKRTVRVYLDWKNEPFPFSDFLMLFAIIDIMEVLIPSPHGFSLTLFKCDPWNPQVLQIN